MLTGHYETCFWTCCRITIFVPYLAVRPTFRYLFRIIRTVSLFNCVWWAIFLTDCVSSSVYHQTVYYPLCIIRLYIILCVSSNCVSSSSFRFRTKSILCSVVTVFGRPERPLFRLCTVPCSVHFPLIPLTVPSVVSHDISLGIF